MLGALPQPGLNPFEIRAGLERRLVLGAGPETVLIPLKSGLGWNRQCAPVTPPKQGLNPFEIRAGLERSAGSLPVLPLVVLIPLKSGLGWNPMKFVITLPKRCLNPFEIRAGLEPFTGVDLRRALES